MAIRIRVEGLRNIQAALNRLPEATMKAATNGINRTMMAIEQHQLVEMERVLDRPSPFTLNALRRIDASPAKPRAVLYIQPIQARYLRYAIEGGTLPVMLTPVIRNIKLNQYGNITGKRGGLPVIARATKRFIAEIGGVYGVWQRTGRGARGVKLLVKVERQAKRNQRWDFQGVARQVIDQRLLRDVSDAIRGAIR